jgi:hypothetical protein
MDESLSFLIDKPERTPKTMHHGLGSHELGQSLFYLLSAYLEKLQIQYLPFRNHSLKISLQRD